MKEKGDKWVPLKKIKNQKEGGRDGRDLGARRERVIRFFFLLISFSDLRKSDRRNLSDQERKVLYETRATRGYQKHWISPRFQVKIRKIIIFSFSHIYDVLTIRIFRSKS